MTMKQRHAIRVLRLLAGPAVAVLSFGVAAAAGDDLPGAAPRGDIPFPATATSAPGPGPVATDIVTPWNLPFPNQADGMALLGHWPNGQSYAVHPLGDLLFAGCGASLVVLDATDPTNLVPIGRLELPGTVLRVLAVDEPEGASPSRIAYVSTIPFGIVVADVSDPTAMRALSFVPTGNRAVEFRREGPLLYCALSSEGLVILDVSDPTEVREVGRWTAGTSLFDFVLAGDLAYLAFGVSGLVTLDVSDPAAPVALHQVASPFPPDACRGVSLVGGHLVTCDFAHVLTWDLTDPAAPALAGWLELDQGLTEMECEGSRAFIGGSGLYEVDVADPLAPRLVWRADDNIAARSLQPRGGRLSLVRYGGPGGALEVELLDVSQPGVVLGLGWFDDGGLLEDVLRFGDRLLSVGHFDGVRVLDARDLAAIVPVAQVQSRIAYDGQLVGDVLWVGHLQGLAGIDLADPEQPRVAGALTHWRMENLAARGDTLLAVGPVAGVPNLRIVDVARPEAPVLIGELALPGLAMDVALRGAHAFVAGLPFPPNGEGLLHVVDWSTPSAPVLLRSLRLSSSGRGVAMADSLLYLACADGAVRIFDVAEPAEPAPQGQFATELDIRGIEVAAGRLYLLSTDGVTSMALEDPLAPRAVARFQTGAMLRRLDVEGDVLFVASYEAGVWVLRDLSLVEPIASGPALRAIPNPFPAATTAVLTAVVPGRHAVRVYDPRGRLVRELFAGELAPGEHRFEWDGRDRRGRACASGTYLLRAEGPQGTVSGAATLVR